MASGISAFNATVFALEYGTPLLLFATFALPIVANRSVNVLHSTGQLATPGTPLGPSDDTIYSEGIYDLSQNDLVITVPQIDADRYFNIALYDPFGGQFASLGTVNETAPGNYLMHLPHGHGDSGVSYGTTPSTTGYPRYKGEVVSPTTFGLILVRALLKNNGSDLAYVQNLLRQCKLSAVPRSFKREPLSTATFQGISSTNVTTLYQEILQQTATASREIILQLTAAFAPENPPWNVSSSESETVHRQLTVAGIRNGSYTPVPGVNLTLAGEAAIAAASWAAIAAQVSLNNGWQRSFPQGIYGYNYVERAVAAISVYLEQTLDQALYATNPASSSLQETPSDSYLYTFSSKPPILSTGFWSLTLYYLDGQFFANPLNRYSLGDRSNLSYPDGSLVYGGPNSSSTDGPFQILVQSIDTPPPANWTSNWLPAPPVATDVTVDIRLYAPTQPIINGLWEYPAITKIVAITGW